MGLKTKRQITQLLDSFIEAHKFKLRAANRATLAAKS